MALFPSDIIEHALAHKLKDEAEAAYQRGDLLLKRAYAMERWAQFCTDRNCLTSPNSWIDRGWSPSTRWLWHIRRIPEEHKHIDGTGKSSNWPSWRKSAV